MPKRVDRATQTDAGPAIQQKDIEKTLLWVKERKKEILLELLRQNAKKKNWSTEESESRKQKLLATFKSQV